MSHTIICPHCTSTNVRMHNPEPMCETAYPETPYVFDSVVTTQAICDDCKEVCTVEGQVTWGQPKMERKTYKVVIELTASVGIDKDELLMSVHNSLLFSHNVTSKATVGKEYFAD